MNEVIQPDLKNVRRYRIEELENDLSYYTSLLLKGSMHFMDNYLECVKSIEVQQAYIQLEALNE